MAKKKKKTKANTKKKPAKKAAKAKKKAAKAAGKPSKRLSWLDSAGTPLIDDYARKLGSFLEAMADGKVDDAEIDAQEKRLVKLMKKVEPMLDDGLHAEVTELLCELTAYDFMQTMHMMQQARTPASLNL